MPVAGLWTLPDVVNAVVNDRAAKNAGSNQKAQKDQLNAVWAAYNSWVHDLLLHRKGAESPNFGNFAWEFFSKSSDLSSEDAYKMSCKPTFVLAAPFIRQYNLPKPKRAQLPPTLAPSEMINFHKIALRYSKSLTKDNIFTDFRDIIRKIGEVVEANKRIKIAFSVGNLLGKDKKVTFEYDLDSLKLDAKEGANQVVFTMQKPDKFNEEAERAKAEAEAAEAEREEAAAAAEADESTPQMGATGFEMDGEYGMEGEEEEEERVKLSGNGTFMAQEEAYERYIRKLEDAAVDEAQLNQSIVDAQKEKDRLWDEKQARKKKKAKDLQSEILDSIETRTINKKNEVLAGKVKTETSFYPKTDRDGGVLAADETTKELGANADTYGVPVNRKFRGLDVPKKGLGHRVSEEELIESLRQQMELKETSKRVEREMKLEEEKRYIEHISMELDFEQHAKQMEALGKKDNMIQAWERERFLAKIKKLKDAGDIDGIKLQHSMHLKSTKLPALNVSQGATASMNQTDSARSGGGFSGAAVGFDSRK
ncbi:hypothetical protein TeGR_g7237 [Tetraparma gracilis]|uniref:Uncharacterized protein n=1 Tax=Tetraparma gracilis TaxID=2962635 RepID=A0ABQ6MRU5_9STRA|nr:hypothetical protein TeGR_g7237 [Tetraparma gracilis]